MLDRRVRVDNRFLCDNKHEFSRTITSRRIENGAPPLHHDECEEVHALSLIQQVVRQRRGVVAKLQGQRGERYAVAFQVPKRPADANLASAKIKTSYEEDRHCHGTERLEDTKEAIRVKEQAAVGQSLRSHVARRAGEQAALWRLQAHAQSGKDVRLQAKSPRESLA
jgi:hypothetical protein